MNVKGILEEQRQIWEKQHSGSDVEEGKGEGSKGTTSPKEPEEDQALKRFILEIMFDRHHLVSTKTKKGVLTVNRYSIIMV